MFGFDVAIIQAQYHLYSPISDGTSFNWLGVSSLLLGVYWCFGSGVLSDIYGRKKFL